MGWKDFVRKNDLTVEFESGLHTDFKTLISTSDFFVTTSITEGFGFSFLEPWTANKMLWGRAIPDVCGDFTKNGVRLNHLYDSLNVPVSWIGEGPLITKLMSCISDNSKKFNFPLNERHALISFKYKIRSGSIDFGLLDETFQKQAISKILASKRNKQLLKSLNPCLSSPGHTVNKNNLISNNKNAVLKNYNKIVYKNNLIRIYKKVINYSVTQSIDKNILTSFFLNPDNFSLLKWSDYAEEN
ncbi:MAG: hypothetical protein MUP22_04150 [Desulfobacterales bacterium]|nr:hypothetical protein [Desulfobacterales bacterium]